MKITKHGLLFIIVMLVACLPSFATWSIIVIDPKTKEIGIAGASCTVSVYGIGAIVPGKGAIVVQAMSNPLARLQAFKMIKADAKPADILNTIRHPDYDPEEQQYAILCMNDINHPATYTGTKTNAHGGTLTANGISVQGNTLTDRAALQAILDAAVKAQKASLPIQEILMLALEAGAKAGGDKRCGARKASSAFVTVSKPDDVEKHWLNLVVYGNDDHTPAVDALRKKFDNWKAKQKTAKSTVNLRQLLNSVYKNVLTATEGSYTLHENNTVLNVGEDTSNRLSTVKYYFKRIPEDTLVGYKINSFHTRGGEHIIYDRNDLYTLYSNTLTIIDPEKFPSKIRQLKNRIYAYPLFVIANSSLQYYNNDSLIENVKYLGKHTINGIKYWKLQIGPGDSTNNRNEAYYYISEKSLLPERMVMVVKNVTGNARQLMIFDYSIRDYKKNSPPAETFMTNSLKYNRVVLYDSSKENIVASTAILKTGDKAPDWTLPIIQGDSLSLSSLINKIVVLDFWYKKCIPCQHQMNSLQALHEKFTDKEVVFVGINLYDDPVRERLELYLKNRNITMTSVYKGALIENLYKINGAPALFIIDRNGTVIYSLEGYSDSLLADVSKIIENQLSNN